MSEKKRNIQELLHLDTFQGMTDDEILSIIDENNKKIESNTRYIVKQEMMDLFDRYMQQFHNSLIMKNDETLKSLIDKGQDYLLTVDAEGKIHEKQ